MPEAVSRAVRAARRTVRLEVIAWQRALAGLLVVSVLCNAVLYSLLHYSEASRESETDRLQAQLRQTERVRDNALRSYGALVRWVERDIEAREAQAAAYEAAGVYQYIGRCEITYYCCEQYEHICGTGDGLTATGIPAGPGIVAVDPAVIPLGSTVVIDGQSYLAADTGGAVRGLHVDICVPTHMEADELGVGTAEVWVVNNG